MRAASPWTLIFLGRPNGKAGHRIAAFRFDLAGLDDALPAIAQEIDVLAG
jgi:hypothetical protein